MHLIGFSTINVHTFTSTYNIQLSGLKYTEMIEPTPDLNGKSILVTGGTGSFGKRFIATVFRKYPDIKKVVVYSRDELKQFEMSQDYPGEEYPVIRFFIGDIRDRDRFKRACEGIDIIVHAAALKQVPAAEYNPMEFINTNIMGAGNVIDAAFDCGVSRVVALSTDKAAAPINLYGATKLCSDKLFIAANNMKGNRNLTFSVVRYGNVIGSRGSVVPYFLEKRKTGILPITHREMTRFNITLDEGVNLVLYAIEKSLGGELFVPKIPSYRIPDMAEAIAPGCKTEVIGIRPGEKLHEEMVTEPDSINTIELDDLYIILPTTFHKEKKRKYMQYYHAKMVPQGFKYSSGKNKNWLTIEELKQLIKLHVDPNFEV